MKIKETIAAKSAATKVWFSKNRNSILTGVSVILVPVSIGLAIHASFKSAKEIDERETELGREMTAKEKVKETGLNYVPCAAAGVASMYLNVKTHQDISKELAGVIATYEMMKSYNKDFKDSTKEVVSEKKQQEILHKTSEKVVERNDIKATPTDDERIHNFVIAWNGKTFQNTIDGVHKGVAKANRRCLEEGCVSMYTLEEFWDVVHYDVEDPVSNENGFRITADEYAKDMCEAVSIFIDYIKDVNEEEIGVIHFINEPFYEYDEGL